MFLLPVHVDVPMRSYPWMNWLLIALTVLFYPLTLAGGKLTPLGESMVLGKGEFGLLGRVLVHGGIVHLIGNMLFLWLFGNAVCAKVGNLFYPLVYFGLGAGAGIVSLALDGRPAIGASGAINGIVGIFIVWYLLNDITVWWYYFGRGGEFQVSSYWMVLLWAAFDLWGVVRGSGNVGHLAHLAGLILGLGLGVLLLATRLTQMERGERSLLQVLFNDATDDR